MTMTIARLLCCLALFEATFALSGLLPSPLAPVVGLARALVGIPPPAQRGGDPRVPTTDTPFVILRKQLKTSDGKERNIKFYRVNSEVPVSRDKHKAHDHVSRVILRAYTTPTSPLPHPQEFVRTLTEKEIIALNNAKDGAEVVIKIPEMRKFFERGARHFSIDSKLWAQEIQGVTPVGKLKLSSHSSTVEPVNGGVKETGGNRTTGGRVNPLLSTGRISRLRLNR